MEKYKIKVLQVNKLYYPWIGGVEKLVQEIAEGLSEKLYVEVLACQAKGRGKREIINGVTVTKAGSLGIFWGMPISFSFMFLLARKSQHFDILHFHFPFPIADLSYLLFVRRKRNSIVVTYHSDIVRQKKIMFFYKPFLKKFLSLADKIIVTSPQMIESSEYLSSFKEKCEVIYPSIDLSKINYDYSQRTGSEREQKTILFVGRLVYYKGVEYLIEAMKKINAKLYIVGEGELKKELINKAIALGVRDKIEFKGKVPDEELQKYYKACDLFVLPSVEPSEAFGLVQLEAMAYGKPVINTNLPTGVPYVSLDGITGFTVSPRDSEALAKAINEILSDEELYMKFSTNARRRVEENFSRNVMLKNILKIYNIVINKKSVNNLIL